MLNRFRLVYGRALPEIMSGPEVLQISKIWTVWKPDIFLPIRQTFKNMKNQKSFFFQNFKMKNVDSFGKMFKNVSPDSVQSGRTYILDKCVCSVLSGQETHMPSPVKP